ncbi:hypothetical protein B9Z55_002534 [Caenorhabditis nigoni]|uniref:Uncharacterized protein n=1 Tax=Caenorhabditis nigoni TaxID=1611254 RepID=A0A2G5VKW6_9PELO|nr:hypothetical protein B9Z55_002534 [Caenorhabditis nigoni]
MQLFVKLNDHQEVTHNHFNLVLNEQLEQEISSIWSIKRDYLDLYFADGRKISGFDLNSHLVQIGLKHLDKVIFKHSNLPNYVEMISYAEEARKAKSDGNVAGIISFVDAALPHLELLTSSNFFVIYPKFGSTLRAFRDDFDQYMLEPSTKRTSQLEKEEDIFDNPIRNDSNDDVMEEDDAFESCGEDTNDSRQFSSIARKDRSVQHIWRGKTTNQN